MPETDRETLDKAEAAATRDYAAAMRICNEPIKKCTDAELTGLATRAAAMGIVGQQRAFFDSLPNAFIPVVFAAMQATLFTVNRLRLQEAIKKARARLDEVEAVEEEQPPEDKHESAGES